MKLVLWYQLLANGMYRMFVRFYWSVWTSAVLVLTGSLLMLAGWDRAASEYGPFWLWGIICFSLVGVSYLIGRVLGMLPLLLVSLVLPATLIIHPMVVGSSTHDIVADDDSAHMITGGVATGDLQQFAKGIAVFGGLVAVAGAAYAACLSVNWVRRSRRWPPRRPAAAALISAGLVALEILRITTRSWPGFDPPWDRLVAHFLSEPGWPYAICIWLWLEVACLLAVYDTEVLPYLLHRIGQGWAPQRLSLADAYMVDQLLAGLVRPSSKSGSRSTQRKHRSRR
jgi:hypothetical protein